MSVRKIATSDTWYNCYADGWLGEIVPAAYQHPAKFSRALIRRIYDHALKQDWLKAGDTVVDPFGGVALGALDAMWNGLHWIGCELEPRFVTLGEQNITLWQFKYRDKVGLGSARLLQGDSRQLASVIQLAKCVISSPPYADQPMNPGETSRLEAKIKRLIEAGNVRDAEQVRQHLSGAASNLRQKDYGSSPGQLGRMKQGEPPQVECVLGSPPYARSLMPDMNDTEKYAELERKHRERLALRRPDIKRPDRSAMIYGSTDGQLGSMPEGRFDAVVSSPPYEGSLSSIGDMNRRDAIKQKSRGQSWGRNKDGSASNDNYGSESGQLGAESGDTFWFAAREIVAQCHVILRPSGHAIWVCKDFVRKGKRIPFSDQWQALCESVGFRLVCRHRAMLVQHHGEQETIFGETERITTERKSFFRRLAEKKGSPAIDWEDVLCLEAS